jgi:Protein of unknown function, DUF547
LNYPYYEFNYLMLKRKSCLYPLIILGVILMVTLSTMNINDIGFKMMSALKKVGQKSVDVASINGVEKAITHELWDELVKQNVRRDGRVNYKGFERRRDDLLLYLELLSDNPPNPKTWSEQEQLAYWINAYNAFTVQLILRNYPIASIKDIAGNIPMINTPWDLKFFRIGEVKFDLNTIEHVILRGQFEEPRIHFAINCASISCPDLRGEAFVAERLDEQLDDQARSFINDTSKNIITSTDIKLSREFAWFKTDFTKHTSIISYIQQYNSVVMENADITYMEYNWNLNE